MAVAGSSIHSNSQCSIGQILQAGTVFQDLNQTWTFRCRVSARLVWGCSQCVLQGRAWSNKRPHHICHNLVHPMPPTSITQTFDWASLHLRMPIFSLRFAGEFSNSERFQIHESPHFQPLDMLLQFLDKSILSFLKDNWCYLQFEQSKAYTRWNIQVRATEFAIRLSNLQDYDFQHCLG